MITNLISDLAVKFLDTAGYAGAAVLMGLESMIAPVPSEAVMPFVGFQVADGKWNLALAIAATSLGSLLGSLISYLMGYYGGKPVVMKVGKYFLLDRHDLELTERFFHKRGGTLTLFLSRFIPVVRHLISIPAGIGKMPLLPFCLATVIGATIWNTFLLGLGWYLRSQWKSVMKYSHQIDVGVVILLALGLAWFIRGRLARRKANSILHQNSNSHR